MHPLILEAAKKAAVAWLTVPEAGQAYLVWGLWSGETFDVVAGPGEQQAPGLAEAVAASVEIRVTMIGDHGGRIVSWPATISCLSSTDDRWLEVAQQLAGKRLNAAGSSEQIIQRWAQECPIYRLSPTGDPAEAGTTLPNGSLVATVRPSTAARYPRKPYRLHKVRRR